MLRLVSLEERPIVVLGLRGGLLGELYTIQRSVQRCVQVSYALRSGIKSQATINNGRRRPRVGQALLQQLVRTETGAECMTKGRKQNRNKSKSWKIGEIRYSDDALVCYVENTVEDRIMDSGASFHATYCKEELERFKLRSGKVRLVDDKTLDIAGVGNVVLKTSFGTSWTLKDVRYIPNLKRRSISIGQLDEGYHVGFRNHQWKDTKGSLVVARRNKCGSLYMVEHQRLGDMSRIGMNMLASKGNVPDIRKVDIYFCKPGGLGKQKKLSFIMSEKTGKLQRGVTNGIVILKMVPETPLQFGVAERLSRTFRAESTGLRLRIPKEDWRGKDTSLAHLKVFGCDSFVKVKDVCGEAMKCTFIGSGSNEIRYSFRDTKSRQVIQSRDITFMDSIYEAMFMTDSSSLTKPIHKSQVVLVDIPENLADNDNIVVEHGLSSKITHSPGGSLDTSEGSKNSGSFKDSGRLDEEDSEDRASSEEGGFETPHVRRSNRESRAPWKKAIKEMVSLEKNQTCSLVRLLAGKKASQSLWMFKVREEQDGRKRCSEKQVLGYVLIVGVTTVEWESRLQRVSLYTKSSIHLAKNLKFCSLAKLVQILITEWSLSLLKILGTKSLAEMFTRILRIESLLALRLVGAACSVAQPQVNPDSMIAQAEQITPLR
ncbi:retrovirus-related pol polyprotein from transposon TNT 1-94 [Tanacetum coccineum]